MQVNLFHQVVAAVERRRPLYGDLKIGGLRRHQRRSNTVVNDMVKYQDGDVGLQVLLDRRKFVVCPKTLDRFADPHRLGIPRHAEHLVHDFVHLADLHHAAGNDTLEDASGVVVELAVREVALDALEGVEEEGQLRRDGLQRLGVIVDARFCVLC